MEVDQASPDKGKDKAKEDGKPDRREELDTLRAQMREHVCQRILALADHHEALVFDAKEAYAITHSQNALLDSLVAPLTPGSSGQEMDEKATKLRLHLLALIFNDSKLLKTIDEDRARSLMQALSAVESLEKVSWVSYCLLVAASLFSFSEKLSEVELLEESSLEQGKPTPSGKPIRSLFAQEASAYLGKIVSFLKSSAREADNETLLALYRLLVVVTRRHDLATAFVQAGGLAALTEPIRQGPLERISGCQSYIVMVLRHIIEDPQTLKHVIEQNLRCSVEQMRTQTINTATLLSHNSASVWRDADVFMEVVSETLQIEDYHKHQASAQMSLKGAKTSKNSESQKQASGKKEAAAAEEKSVDGALVSPSKEQTTLQISEQSEAVIAFLLGELMSPTLEVSAPPLAQAKQTFAEHSAQPGHEQGTLVEVQQAEKKDAADMLHFYACFLMQLLAELVASYDSCKLSFMNFHKKRQLGSSSGSIPAKLRTAALNYFFNDLIVPGGAVTDADSTESRNKRALANLAMSVIVALTADTAPHAALKDVNPELISVRKHVLDGLCKAIRDLATTNDSVDAKYGKTSVLAELCHRLLTAKPNDMGMRQNEDLSLHIAKLMLEKNFVAVLTTALADIDLHLPLARPVLEKVLKPLEHLTRVSIRMGRADKKEKGTESSERRGSQYYSSMMSVEEAEEEQMDSSDFDEMDDAINSQDRMRDETPDFYRNSSLGMHTGELEAGAYHDELSEDEMDEDEDDVEMEDYDSEDTGSDLRLVEIPSVSTRYALTDLSCSDESEEDGEVEVVDMLDGEDESDDEDDMDDDDEEEDAWTDEVSARAAFPFVFCLLGQTADLECMLSTAQDDGSDDGSSISGELDFVIDGDETVDGLAPAIMPAMEREDEEDMMFPAPTFAHEDEEEEEEGNPGTPTDGYEGEDFTELELDDLAMGPPPPAMDRFGANWGWANASSGSRANPGAFPTTQGQIDTSADGVVAGAGGRWASRLLEGSSRSTRLPRAIPEDVASHPLLVDRPPDQPAPASGTQRLPRRRIAQVSATGQEGWMSALEAAVGGGASQFLEAVLSRAQGMGMGDEVRLSITAPGNGGTPQVHVDGLTVDAGGQTRQQPRSEKGKDLVTTIQEFVPMSTMARWQQEASIVHGRNVDRLEKATILKNELHNALLPSYWQRRREEIEKEKQRLKVQEEKRKETERKTEAEAKEKQEAENKEQAMKEAQDSSAAGEDVDMDDESQPKLELGSLEQGLAELSDSGNAQEEASSSAAAQPNASSAPEQSAAGSTAPTSGTAALAPSQRTTVTIHGREVDISDSGIDVEFLEALPDDMRQEIVEQHLRDRQTATLTASASSNIAPEFLEALPPDIRAEVIQQELISNRVRAARNAAGESRSQAEEAHEEDERDDEDEDEDEERLTVRPGDARRQGPSIARAARPPLEEATSKPPPRDAIQLLDKSGIAALVRLLFFPQLDGRTAGLHRVLAHLTENSRSRGELLSLLLMILWDGTSGTAAVDKSFAAMSAKIQKSFSTPKALKKSATTPVSTAHNQTPITAPISGTGEEAPYLVAIRCVECLSHLAHHNEQVAHYFLKEEPRQSRKGKGKDRAIEKYGVAPIATLLALLERPVILEHAVLLDNLIAL